MEAIRSTGMAPGMQEDPGSEIMAQQINGPTLAGAFLRPWSAQMLELMARQVAVITNAQGKQLQARLLCAGLKETLTGSNATMVRGSKYENRGKP